VNVSELGGYISTSVAQVDHSLAERLVISGTDKDLPAGLQDRNPGLDRVCGNSQLSSKLGLIEQGSASIAQQSEQTVEVPEVADIGQCTNIPLQIGLQVGSVPGARVEIRARAMLTVDTPCLSQT